MKQSFSAAQLVDLEYKSLANGTPIKGIQIDNPGGSWLYVVSENEYCPPYTIGWAIPLTYEQSSITVRSGNGPSDQVGTNQGDDWRLTLFDEDVSPSAGVPHQFIEKFTPNSFSVASLIDVTVNGSPATVLTIAAVANKRLRIKTVNIGTFGTDAPFRVEFWATTLLWRFYLRPPQTYEVITFEDGFDLPVGQKFEIIAYAVWAGNAMNALVTYQVL